jgi:hypothetical protein
MKMVTVDELLKANSDVAHLYTESKLLMLCQSLANHLNLGVTYQADVMKLIYGLKTENEQVAEISRMFEEANVFE